MSTREPRWDIDYEHGRQAELWVSDIRTSLRSDSVEVKHDLRALETGNVYVEYECLRKGEWTKSGLATSAARIWVFVLVVESLAIVVSAERLREVGRKAYADPRNHRDCTKGSHPTRGVAVPIGALLGVPHLREIRRVFPKPLNAGAADG